MRRENELEHRHSDINSKVELLLYLKGIWMFICSAYLQSVSQGVWIFTNMMSLFVSEGCQVKTIKYILIHLKGLRATVKGIKLQICCTDLLLQHQTFGPQVLLKGAPLLHLWAGLLINQNIVNSLFPIPKKKPGGANWSLSLRSKSIEVGAGNAQSLPRVCCDTAD